MTGHKNRGVAHRPQALLDAIDQVLVIALGEIGAADAARKQNIAHKSALRLWRVKHHMARRMSWAMAHLHSAIAHLHRVAVVQPTRGREGFGGRKAEHLRLHGHAIYPKLVGWVRANDRHAMLLRQSRGCARMV